MEWLALLACMAVLSAVAFALRATLFKHNRVGVTTEAAAGPQTC